MLHCSVADRDVFGCCFLLLKAGLSVFSVHHGILNICIRYEVRVWPWLETKVLLETEDTMPVGGVCVHVCVFFNAKEIRFRVFQYVWCLRDVVTSDQIIGVEMERGCLRQRRADLLASSWWHYLAVWFTTGVYFTGLILGVVLWNIKITWITHGTDLSTDINNNYTQ